MKAISSIINVLDWITLKVIRLFRWLTIILVAAIALDVFVGVFFRSSPRSAG